MNQDSNNLNQNIDNNVNQGQETQIDSSLNYNNLQNSNGFSEKVETESINELNYNNLNQVVNTSVSDNSAFNSTFENNNSVSQEVESKTINDVNYNELNQGINNISGQSTSGNTNIPNYNNLNATQQKNDNSKIIIGVLVGVIVLLILSFVIFIVVNNRQKSNVSDNDNTVNVTQKESDEAETNDNVVEDDNKEDTNQTEENETISNISSSDWKSGEFQLGGNSFKLNSDYSTLVSKGWSVDMKKYGYSNGYILNHKDKILSTLDLENSKFSDSRVTIGIINLDTAAKDVTECQFWAISVDNSYTKTPVDFALPGGIKSGSTIKEIEKVYGVPESKNIYRAESSGYTVYTYEYDYSIYLKLTIYDTDGLKGFDYKMY